MRFRVRLQFTPPLVLSPTSLPPSLSTLIARPPSPSSLTPYTTSHTHTLVTTTIDHNKAHCASHRCRNLGYCNWVISATIKPLSRVVAMGHHCFQSSSVVAAVAATTTTTTESLYIIELQLQTHIRES